jgi:hypothetical protein
MRQIVSLKDEFAATDSFLKHLDQVVSGIDDAFIIARYTGFHSLMAASAFETTAKKILLGFAASQGEILRTYCARDLHRINGRIRIKDFKETYLANFGAHFSDAFELRLAAADRVYVRSKGYGIRAAYGSLLTCRHEFAHEGQIPSNSSYPEIQKGYAAGKVLLGCLQNALLARRGMK